MNKVLVDVFVPAANAHYDIYIPLESRMSEVSVLIAGSISDISEGKYKTNAEAVICNAQTGDIFNINLSVAELGITNGSKLILI
jgi:hypothetical protein